MQMETRSYHGKSSSTYQFKKNKSDSKKDSKPLKTSTKEAMGVSTGESVRILRKSMSEEMKASYSKEKTKKHPTLKELRENKYPFPDPDLYGMLDDQLENNIIKLPETKRPDEARTTIDPKYCHYHKSLVTLWRSVRITQLSKEVKIILNLDDTAETNCICTQLEFSLSSLRQDLNQLHQEVRSNLIDSLRTKLFAL